MYQFHKPRHFQKEVLILDKVLIADKKEKEKIDEMMDEVIEQ